MSDFQELLGFTIGSLEYQIEKEMSGKDPNDEMDGPTQKQTNIVQDFELLLDMPSMKKMKKLVSQNKFLHEKVDLLPEITGFVRQLESRFGKEENAKNLAAEYDRKLNP